MASSKSEDVAASRVSQAPRQNTAQLWAHAQKSVVYLVLIVLALLTLFPLAWMVLTSLTPTDQTFGNLIPSRLDSSGYSRIWAGMDFPQALTNTVIVTLMTVVIVVVVATLSGYAFARLPFPGREWFFYLFLACLMIPGAAILIPMFIFLKNINLLNTLPGLSFSYLGGALPFATFLMRAFFKTLPAELGDAGKIDGCNEVTVFSRVYMPLTAPGIATITIFQFVGTWNEFMFANTLISSQNLKTIQASVFVAVGQYGTDWPALTAGLTMAIVPIVFVYLILQRQFISGLTAGALKG